MTFLCVVRTICVFYAFIFCSESPKSPQNKRGLDDPLSLPVNRDRAKENGRNWSCSITLTRVRSVSVKQVLANKYIPRVERRREPDLRWRCEPCNSVYLVADAVSNAMS